MTPVITAPLGLLGLLSLPVILWLHRYVATPPPRKVSHVALWKALDAHLDEGQRAERPPLTWVLVLQLLAATALTGVMAGISVNVPTTTSVPVGIVVDSTYSMRGGPPGHSGRQDAATWLASLVTGGPARVALAGPDPHLLPTRSATEAAQALTEELFVGTTQDVDGAIDLLVAAGVPPDRVWVLTDAPEALVNGGEVPPTAQVVPVGGPADNLALYAPTWIDDHTAGLSLRTYGDSADVTLRVDADGEISTHQVRLAADDAHAFEVEVGSARRVRFFVEAADGLALDNEAALRRPSEDPLAVYLDHRSAAVTASFRRAVLAIPQLFEVGDPTLGIVVLHDGSTPREAPFSITVPTASATATASDLQTDPFSSWMDGFDTRDLRWSVPPGEPPAGRALLRSDVGPLLTYSGRRLHLHLAPTRSNFFERDAFVVLLYNLATELHGLAGGLARANLAQGSPMGMHLPANWPDTVTWQPPAGASRSVVSVGGEVQLGRVHQLGEHTLGEGSRSLSFAVHLADPKEGDLQHRGAASGSLVVPPRPQIATRNVHLDRHLALLAMLCMGAAWALLRTPAEAP